jgi:hypothetical protein
MSATFSNAQAAGDLIVVAVGWSDATAAISSVSDSKGNTYTLAVGPTAFFGVGQQSIYYAKNIVAATAGSNTVTVAFNATVVWPNVRVLEYSGVDTTNPFDGAVATIGRSAATMTTPLTTTNAHDVLVSANYV